MNRFVTKLVDKNVFVLINVKFGAFIMIFANVKSKNIFSFS